MGNLDRIGIVVVVLLLGVIIVVSFFDSSDEPEAKPGSGEVKTEAEAPGDNGGRSHKSQLSAALRKDRNIDGQQRPVSPRDIPGENTGEEELDFTDAGGKGRSRTKTDTGRRTRPGPSGKKTPAPGPGPLRSDPRWKSFPKKGVLKEGQQLGSEIAKVYGLRIGRNMVAAVLRASGIQDDTRIRSGAALVFPAPPASLLDRLDGRSRKGAQKAKLASGTSAKPKGAAKSGSKRRFLWEPESSGVAVKPAVDGYVVKPGETLSEIAEKQLGSMKRWKEIMTLNGITKAEKVRAGDVLKLPKR